MKTYYQIDGDNNHFPTLREAKHHVYIAYTERERLKYLQGCNICGVAREEITTITPIIIDEAGGYRFGKTRKF